jgi:MATE family multidrug resistance protein
MTLHEIRRELIPTLALAAPIMAGQFAQMLIGLADTIMVGRIGVAPLAACAFANTIVYLPFLFALGVMTSTAVRTSHAVGAGNNSEAAETLRHGVFLAVVFGALCFLTLAVSSPLLNMMGQPPEVVALSRNYLLIVGASLLPVLVGIAFKNHCEALNHPWLPFWITMGGVVLNIALNWVMVFGKLGFPALGLDGAGWATLISRIATMAGLAAVIVRLERFREHRPARWFTPLAPGSLRNLLGIGLPSGGQLLMEVGAFSASGLMMGWLGAAALAAHQVALSCAATTFMFPLGLSMALTIRVGQTLGAREYHRMRVIAAGAIAIGIALMAVFAALFLIFRHPIAHAFVKEGEHAVVAITTLLLVVAALFQIFDGAQVVCMGALRGLSDVKWPTWITIACYWGISLPLGYVLAFPAGMGPLGIWIGILTGLVAAAVSLGVRLSHKIDALTSVEA